MSNTDDVNIEVIRLGRDNIIALITSITSQPKPNYDIDGQKVLWADYLKMLMANLKTLNEQIAFIEDPFEIETQGYV